MYFWCLVWCVVECVGVCVGGVGGWDDCGGIVFVVVVVGRGGG